MPIPGKDSSSAVAVSWIDVSDEEAGQRIDNYLLARLKGVPKSRIYRILRSGEVRINSKRVEPSQKVVAGDRVRVQSEGVPGHIRLPLYIRGKVGVVVSESPPYPFPDAHAHGIEAQDEPTYDVRFRSEDLWPNASDPALVYVGVFQSYLERA